MSERGSASAELVICAPILMLLSVVALLIGRLVLQQSQVVDVARTAAEAASLWPTGAQAHEAALLTASYELVHDGLHCIRPVIAVDTSDLVPGGEVSVEITCPVALAPASISGLPGSVTLRESAVAPIEVYREIG